MHVNFSLMIRALPYSLVGFSHIYLSINLLEESLIQLERNCFKGLSFYLIVGVVLALKLSLLI